MPQRPNDSCSAPQPLRPPPTMLLPPPNPPQHELNVRSMHAEARRSETRMRMQLRLRRMAFGTAACLGLAFQAPLAFGKTAKTETSAEASGAAAKATEGTI